MAFNLVNRAEMTSSIRGESQTATIVCISIKNKGGIGIKTGSLQETIQKIINTAENNRALTYENGGDFYFLFVPSKTKTFNNERKAIDLAQTAKTMLYEHNRIFKEKADFGVSVTNGTIVIKPDLFSIKFTSMGSSIVNAKKIASSVAGEIVISREVREKMATEARAELLMNRNDAYILKNVKKPQQNEETKTFMSRFVSRYEKENPQTRKETKPVSNSNDDDLNIDGLDL